jgi:hypothetical protein
MLRPVTNPAAARWLLAEFEATDLDEISVEFYDERSDSSYWLPVYAQPMFVLKSQMEPGAGMHITESDYADPVRWWL